MSSSPRLWPNPPGNSPLPLPSRPMFFSTRELSELAFPQMPTQDKIDLAELKEYVGNFSLENGQKVSQVIDLEKRRPLLIKGELANPYRLCDIMAPDMPIIPVRLEGGMQNMGRQLRPKRYTARNPSCYACKIAGLVGAFIHHLTRAS